MRRSTPLRCLLLALFLLWPVGRVAAGGATFEFAKQHYEPGEAVEASSSVWMGRGATRLLEEGPFHAYLVPAGRRIDPPRIPAGSSRLGIVEFTLTGRQEAVANVSFVVPDVPPATYGVAYCNDPCTVAGVGDLVGGWFNVAEDAEQAALVARISRLELKNSQMLFRIRKLTRENRQIDRLKLEAATTEDRASEMQRDLIILAGELREEREARDPGPRIGWIMAAAVAGVIVGLLLRRRRRPPRPYASPIREAERLLERVP